MRIGLLGCGTIGAFVLEAVTRGRARRAGRRGRLTGIGTEPFADGPLWDSACAPK